MTLVIVTPLIVSIFPLGTSAQELSLPIFQSVEILHRPAKISLKHSTNKFSPCSPILLGTFITTPSYPLAVLVFMLFITLHTYCISCCFVIIPASPSSLSMVSSSNVSIIFSLVFSCWSSGVLATSSLSLFVKCALTSLTWCPSLWITFYWSTFNFCFPFSSFQNNFILSLFGAFWIISFVWMSSSLIFCCTKSCAFLFNSKYSFHFCNT